MPKHVQDIKPHLDPAADPVRASTETGLRRVFRTSVAVLSVTLRILLGVLWTGTGTSWFRRADPTGYLTDAITRGLADGRPAVGMEAFLESVVLSNPGVFTALVAIGESSVGISLLLGIRPRWGILGGAFLSLTYALSFDAQLFVPGNQLLFAIFVVLLFGKPDRWLRLDRIFERWRANRSG